MDYICIRNRMRLTTVHDKQKKFFFCATNYDRENNLPGETCFLDTGGGALGVAK